MKQGQYEITYLIDPRTSEDARGALCAILDEHITAGGGVVASSTPVLRKMLAYPIKHQHVAFIRTMHIAVDSEKIGALQSFLKKTEGVLRLTVLATPARTRMSQELIEKYSKRKGKPANGRTEKEPRVTQKKPAKEVTMQDVEKGIEEALVTEVK